jgi:HSP20 family molecular chaperone IbpA
VTSFRNRNLRMPANANLEDIKANYSDGTLEIKIAKRSDIESTGGRRVQVA